MTLTELRGPIKRVFWAYFLIYINFNLNSLNILPAWAGYLMLFGLLGTLAPEQPSVGLLRPFSLALAASALWDWTDQLLGGGLPVLPGWLTLILGLITLYFHFQLFTDLAQLARRRGVPPRWDGPGPRRGPAGRPRCPGPSPYRFAHHPAVAPGTERGSHHRFDRLSHRDHPHPVSAPPAAPLVPGGGPRKMTCTRVNAPAGWQARLL